MLHYPDINPILLQLGPVAIHWYGTMYLISFILGYALFKKMTGWDTKKVDDLLFYVGLGVIGGGRLGYAVFYAPEWFLQPLQILKVWQGGMSFHGGLLGVLLAGFLFARKMHMPYLALMDKLAIVVPIGLFFGRIGNFISGQLWGIPTNLPWGMVFPFVDNLPRHPSQIYEALLEGFVLFVILWFYNKKNPYVGRVSALFLVGYSVFRMLVEYVRVPDAQYGYIGGVITAGQILCMPMLLLGLFLWVRAKNVQTQE